MDKNQKSKLVPEEKSKELAGKLAEIKLKEKEKEIKRESLISGFPYINLIGFPISTDALNLISFEEANKNQVVCFYRDEKEARLASPQPAKLEEFAQKIQQEQKLKIELYLTSEHSFDSALKLYANLPIVKPIVKGIEIREIDLLKFKDQMQSFRDLNQLVQKASITDRLNLLIASAIQSRASDIHIEAEEGGIKVRFRIDGALNDVAEISKEFWSQIVSRIKLLSGLKINVTDRPQDGRFTIFLANDKIDVRVSCLPTAYGESIVMRLLRSSATGLAFEDLGLRGGAYERLKKEIERPNGMILNTGPTGSGKTTTLYAILNKLNTPETKIITLEDPIEYRLKGINQSQVDYSKGYTFAKGLRSIMRQNPDIIMIGEIRDLETAEIAVQAALTGHLVVSTLHTNDAAGAIPRLLLMGVKPYLLAPSINAIIGQRLVRRICPDCKTEINLEPEVLERVRNILKEIPESVKVEIKELKFYQGRGCSECQGIGYRGQIGIFEILLMSPEIEKLILTGQVSEYQMRDLAKAQGMVAMVQDGILKALDGITTIEEVFRVAE